MLLALLTFFWGINWPIMKFAVESFPPFLFRLLSMVIGAVGIGVYMVLRRERFFVPVSDRRRVTTLAIWNMLLWQVMSIYAIQALSSGRAAIIGYTMPMWAFIAGALLFKEQFRVRSLIAVALALVATTLLANEEINSFFGRPYAFGLMLASAISWGIGTVLMKHLRVSISNMALTFWMLVFTSVFLLIGSIAIESNDWRSPSIGEWLAILYNAGITFALCHILWFRIARNLTPVASSISIMLIPVIGVFSGTVALGEPITSLDLTALGLILIAMAVGLNLTPGSHRRN